MHNSYEEKLKHKADFRVKYRFYTVAEGGRKALPFQGIRSDFWYPNESNEPGKIFMIWPEFEDENGNLILDNNRSINSIGTARMWVIVPEQRNFHKRKLEVGTRGYFKEGNKSTAECEVVEILGLNENPTQSNNKNVNQKY